MTGTISNNNVKFQTVTIGKVCANAHQGGGTLELSCQGGRILSNLRFVSFGDPEGTCGSFSRGICESPLAFSVIEEACIGKEECSIDVSEGNLGPTSCWAPNRLVVEVDCSYNVY